MKKLILLTSLWSAPLWPLAAASGPLIQPATQTEVNAGVIHNKYVAPDTLSGFALYGSTNPVAFTNNSSLPGVIVGSGIGTNMAATNLTGKILSTTLAPTNGIPTDNTYALTLGVGTNAWTLMGTGTGVTDVQATNIASYQAFLAAEGLVPNTIFVDATTGSDTTGDGTSGKPYATLIKGQTIAVSGQTVAVMRGNFLSETLGKEGVSWYFNDGVVCTNVLWNLSLATVTNQIVSGRGVLNGTVIAVSATNAYARVTAKSLSCSSPGYLVSFYSAAMSNVVDIAADTISGRWNYATASMTNTINLRSSGDIILDGVPSAGAAVMTNFNLAVWPGRTFKLNGDWAGSGLTCYVLVHQGAFDRNGQITYSAKGASTFEFDNTRIYNAAAMPTTNIQIVGSYILVNP